MSRLISIHVVLWCWKQCTGWPPEIPVPCQRQFWIQALCAPSSIGLCPWSSQQPGLPMWSLPPKPRLPRTRFVAEWLHTPGGGGIDLAIAGVWFLTLLQESSKNPEEVNRMKIESEEQAQNDSLVFKNCTSQSAKVCRSNDTLTVTHWIADVFTANPVSAGETITTSFLRRREHTIEMDTGVVHFKISRVSGWRLRISSYRQSSISPPHHCRVCSQDRDDWGRRIPLFRLLYFWQQPEFPFLLVFRAVFATREEASVLSSCATIAIMRCTSSIWSKTLLTFRFAWTHLFVAKFVVLLTIHRCLTHCNYGASRTSETFEGNSSSPKKGGI